jgi:hypothetical protein
MAVSVGLPKIILPSKTPAHVPAGTQPKIEVASKKAVLLTDIWHVFFIRIPKNDYQRSQPYR